MSGWDTVTLAEVCTNIQDGAHRSPQVFHQEAGPGRFLYITSKNIRNGYLKLDKVSYCEANFHEAIYRRCNAEYGDVLLTKDGASTGNVTLNTLREPISLLSSVCLLKTDREKLIPAFLYYYIRSDHGFRQLTGKMTGAAIKRIILRTIKKSEISLPCVAEQKRIVAILDEAFAAIAKAKENAEKNLANARELFESYLNRVFTQQGDGWQEKPLGELVAVKHGFAFKSKYFVEHSDYIVLTPGSFYEEGGFRDRGGKTKYYDGEIPDGFIHEKGDFVVAMTEQAAGLLGSSLIVPEGNRYLHNQRLGLVQPKPNVPWHNQFFAHAFNTRHFRSEVHRSASGVKVRHTSPKKMYVVTLGYPTSLTEQRKVAKRLDAVLALRRRLETIYTQKLANLDELKQSLLQKAFTGQLTTAAETIVTVPSLPVFPIPVEGISTTDLHAGILGLAYQRHQAPKTSHFGRVKGEKIAHLIENHLGIALERSPIKDAAGPNDFGRIQTVESRAKKAGFFAVEKQADRYALKPRPNFESLIAKTERCLADQLPGVMSIIELMAKMSTRQAEILATAFAAWNNLLTEGKDCSDEAIVYEARENWHPKKLKIEPEKFVKAIKWMRDKEIIPAGRGKIVTAKSA